MPIMLYWDLSAPRSLMPSNLSKPIRLSKMSVAHTLTCCCYFTQAGQAITHHTENFFLEKNIRKKIKENDCCFRCQFQEQRVVTVSLRLF
jgi:hypothetical protein